MQTVALEGVRTFLAVKVDALRRLGDMVGLFDGSEHPWPSYIPPFGAIAERMLDSNALPEQKRALAHILDHLVPWWRGEFPELLGIVVERNDPAVVVWRRAVLKRDGRRCVDCGAHDHLHAHHIRHWSRFPTLRLLVSNGKTLCADCHLAAHGGAWR